MPVISDKRKSVKDLKSKRQKNSEKSSKMAKTLLDLNLSRKLTVIPVNSDCNMEYWLNDIHIDLSLESLRKKYTNVKILTLGM